MLSKSTILFFIFLASFFNISAQEIMEPVKLGDEINTEYDEVNPIITPDGKTLFFTRVNHPENHYGKWDSEDIWYSEKQVDGSWSEARRFPQFNVGRYNAIVSISPDGKTLLLNGVYNHSGNFWKHRGLSIATKTDNGWSKPKRLKVKGLRRMNEGLHSNAYMSADGKHLMLSLSRRYNGKRNDFYVSHLKHGRKWSKPKRLKDVNARRSDEAPFLSADNKFLYFSSDMEKKGRHDLYKAEAKNARLRKWKDIELLAEPLNSSGWESYLKTNAKGSIAYYSTNTNSNGGADIFWIRLFKELDYVDLDGLVVDSKTQKPIIGVQFNFMLDSQSVDPKIFSFNSDSSIFRAKLPFGKKYTLTAEAEGFNSIPLILDFTKINEYQKMKKNLSVETITYVLVKGRLLDSETGQKIPKESNPSILVNNLSIDSLLIDYEAGTYEIRLPYGQQYALQIVADNYVSDTIPLDLTNVNYYQKITKDLYSRVPLKKEIVVEEIATLKPVILPVAVVPIIVIPTPQEIKPINENKAFVTGEIIDTDTKSAFSGQQVKLLVNGELAPKGSILDDGTYELRLELGKDYSIYAQKEGYYSIHERVDLRKETSNIVRYDIDLQLSKIQSNKPFLLKTVFAVGKADLTEESFETLKQLLEFMEANSSISIKIEGHSDNQGSQTSNLQLSKDRAKAVRDYLVNNGIASKRISYEGYGETKPITPNNSTEGRAQNRRVEFRILE